MNVKNCSKCGRIYNYMYGPNICQRCRDAQEAKFQSVKKYIQDHGKAEMAEVSEECDVDTAQIRQWIREERLQFADDSPIKVSCESCGTMIGSGRFCNQCKNELANNFKATANKMKPKQPVSSSKKKTDGERMRFLER